MKKSIKRASSLALAMMMAGSMMPMAFAEDATIDQENPTEGHIDLSYTVASSYKVTYPTTVEAAAGELSDTVEKSFTINISDVSLASGKELQVTVTPDGQEEGNQLGLQLENPVGGAGESISIKFGHKGSDFSQTKVMDTFSNNKGLENSVMELAYKLSDATQLNGKSAGKYTGRVTIKAEPIAKA